MNEECKELEERCKRLAHAYEIIEGVLISKTERAYMRGHGYERSNWTLIKAREEMREFHRNNVGLLPGDLETQ